jgi:hypothetical protein
MEALKQSIENHNYFFQYKYEKLANEMGKKWGICET